MGDKYFGYTKSLEKLDMETMAERRTQLCLSFALKCRKNPKTKDMFPDKQKMHTMKTRNTERYKVKHTNKERFKKPAIIHMQNLLNDNELKTLHKGKFP